MAISDNYAPDKTSGNGVTAAFTGSWNTIAATYFRLYWEDKTTGVQTLKTQGTHYTLAFTASGYTATHDALYLPPSTVWVIRARAIDLTQTDPYKTSTGFQGLTVENSFDKLTAISQDLQDQIDRCVKFPLGNQATITNPAYGDLPVDGYGIVWDGTTGLMRNTTASLADLEGDAETVADNIASVVIVATNIASVISAVANVANINLVAGSITNVNLVGGSIANVNTVATAIAAVNTVSAAIANVNTVATNIANVNTVAGISANVTTVAGIQANVTTVAGIATAVSAVAADLTAINAVYADLTKIDAVYADLTKIDGVYAIRTDVTGVNAIAANVTTVAGISANVTTVAGISANVTTVASNSTNVTTVATNIATVIAAAAAINSAMKFTFATSTVMADPTTGLLRFNNATPASVTAIAIDDLSAQSGNPDLSAYIPTWDDATGTNKGTLIITKGSAPATFAIYTITGLTDNAGWTQLAVTYVTGSGTFSAADDLYLSFVRNGDTGATGAAGSIPVANGAGTADAITADFSPDITIADNALCVVVSSGANTITNPTLNTDGTGALTIKGRGNAALQVGDTGAAGYTMIFRYEATGTYWELLNPKKPLNADVIGSVITGYVSGAGTVAATDTILQAINKLNGNQAAATQQLVLLATRTASASSTLDFTSVISSSYDKYILVIRDLICGSAATTLLLCASDNATFTDTMASQVAACTADTNAPTYTGTADTGSGVIIVPSIAGATPFSGAYEIAVALRCSVGQGFCTSAYFSHLVKTVTFSSDNGGSNPLNALRLKPSAGTFTSGKAYLFALKNT